MTWTIQECSLQVLDKKEEDNSANHTTSMRKAKQNKAATKNHAIPVLGTYLTNKVDTKTDLDFPGFRRETQWHTWPCKDICSIGCDSPRAFQCKQFGGCTERHRHLWRQSIQFLCFSSKCIVRICFSDIAGIILVLRSYSSFYDCYYYLLRTVRKDAFWALYMWFLLGVWLIFLLFLFVCLFSLAAFLFSSQKKPITVLTGCKFCYVLRMFLPFESPVSKANTFISDSNLQYNSTVLLSRWTQCFNVS